MLDIQTIIGVLLVVAVAYAFTNRKKAVVSLRIRKFSKAGVKFVDPTRTYIEKGVRIGRGTKIYPNVYLYSGTQVGEDCVIYPEVHLFESEIGYGCTIWPGVSIVDTTLRGGNEVHKGVRMVRSFVGKHTTIDSFSLVKDSVIGAKSKVGPMAYVRDKSILGKKVEVANIEIVRSHIGEGTKAKHGRYIGDATIGKNCNIGAGTVFCNYDGSQKHKAILGDDVFVGSGVMLIAPITLGKKSFIAAGSVVSRDVSEETLAVARGQKHTHMIFNDVLNSEYPEYIRDAVEKDEEGWKLKKTRR
ncbi:MAG: DapH/DapD/GlmU-related protein [Candidatus Spechtbacterales bacterium]